MLFITTFVILIIIAVAMYKEVSESTVCPKHDHFRKLQRQYLIVFYIASFSNWIQEPYIYKVYSDYGYTGNENAVLYIVGFASSLFIGTFVGHLADNYGRKSLSASYGIVYSLSCVITLSSNYYVLIIGHMIGGISTSILCTTFEAWYINEHMNHYNLPVEWLNSTFSKASFYTGIVAIAAGIVSEIAAEVLDLGPVAPFIIAIPFLLLSTIAVMFSWTEHTTCTKEPTHFEVLSPLKVIFKSPKLLTIGFVQSLFEATFYTFVFSWTPIIASLEPPLGIVFASFMVSFMIGPKIYALLISKDIHAESILIFTTLLSFISITTVSISIYIMRHGMENDNLDTSTEKILTQICFYCFLTYEVCVGMYFPGIGYIRGKIVPEEQRASVTNWFRVPMNIFTCLSLTLNQFCEKDVPTDPISLNTFRQFSYVYLLCSIFLFISFLLMLIYRKHYTTLVEPDTISAEAVGTNEIEVYSISKDIQVDRITKINSIELNTKN